MKKFEYIVSVQCELEIWNNKHKQNERMTMQMFLNHLGSFGWDIFPKGLDRYGAFDYLAKKEIEE